MGVTPEVLALFACHQWPGNFRQLANVLRTSCAMLDDDEAAIGMKHLPRDFLQELDDIRIGAHARPATVVVPAAPLSPPSLPAIGSAAVAASSFTGLRLQDLASSAVVAALTAHGGNVSAAARALGVSRNTLYRKMAAAGLMKKTQ